MKERTLTTRLGRAFALFSPFFLFSAKHCRAGVSHFSPTRAGRIFLMNDGRKKDKQRKIINRNSSVNQSRNSVTFTTNQFDWALKPTLCQAISDLMNKRADDLKAAEADLAELTRSIDRSRKRHLSVGLLRGDQVMDRLRVQEEAASPLLKKTRADANDSPASSPEPYFSPVEVSQNLPSAAPTMAMTMADFKAYMDANTHKRLDSIDESVRGNSKRLDEQADSIKANPNDIQKIQGELDKIKSGAFPALPEAKSVEWPHRTLPSPTSGAPSHAEEASYRLARKSLRFWLVPGLGKDAIWDATGIFLGTKLALKGKLDQTKIVSVARPAIPSGPGVKDEVL